MNKYLKSLVAGCLAYIGQVVSGTIIKYGKGHSGDFEWFVLTTIPMVAYAACFPHSNKNIIWKRI